jgi:hypothetical protein
VASSQRRSEYGESASRGLLTTLQRHRAVRAGFSQFVAASVALLLGLLLPNISGGPQISSGAAQPFLFAVAGGLISFIALVFSLLFLLGSSQPRRSPLV